MMPAPQTPPVQHHRHRHLLSTFVVSNFVLLLCLSYFFSEFLLFLFVLFLIFVMPMLVLGSHGSVLLDRLLGLF